MEIEPITAEEFYKTYQHRGANRSDLSIAVSNLKDNEGLQTPCIWKHGQTTSCAGASKALVFARRHGFKVRTSCHNGILRVLRLPKKEGE